MKEQIELKTACSNLLQGVQQCFGYELCSKLEQHQLALEDENLTIDLILPKNEEDNFVTCSRSTKWVVWLSKDCYLWIHNGV